MDMLVQQTHIRSPDWNL
jgi:U5 small nuclear ribonucleoprotein component